MCKVYIMTCFGNMVSLSLRKGNFYVTWFCGQCICEQHIGYAINENRWWPWLWLLFVAQWQRRCVWRGKVFGLISAGMEDFSVLSLSYGNWQSSLLKILLIEKWSIVIKMIITNYSNILWSEGDSIKILIQILDTWAHMLGAWQS